MRIVLATVSRSVRPRILRNPLRTQKTVQRLLSTSPAVRSQTPPTIAIGAAPLPQTDLSIMAPKIELKTPKGTRDWAGADINLREHIFKQITTVFQRHGGVALDTPVFELKDVLLNKYGEDGGKLVYDLADQGGEICSLRYDLTVPFARYLAENKITSMKRYQLAKVYRRDQPALSKGRAREFFQCDFDIAGANTDPMIADAEILRIVCEVFDSLPGWKGTFVIKLNHRKILDGIFEVCGVPKDKIRTISSAVDKLDKLPWQEVKAEMLQKELPEDVADKIGEWVVLKGKKDLLEKLQNDEGLRANESMQQGMADLELLFNYLEYFNALGAVSFDLSLARGLDYYTGIIYEVVTEGSAPEVLPSAQKAAVKPEKKKGTADPDEDRSNDPTLGFGSVAAGGRYDELVGMFSGGKNKIPCVGISFGVDRVIAITKARMAAAATNAFTRNAEVDVYVMAFGGKGFTGLLKERMTVCATLWDAGLKTEFLYKTKPKLPNQFKAAEANTVPLAVILGEDELANGTVRVKEMGLPEGHPDKDGVLVPLDNLVAEVQQRLERKKHVDDLAIQAEGLKVAPSEQKAPGTDAAAAAAAPTTETTATPDPVAS